MPFFVFGKLLKGMKYIHDSPVCSHGRLRSDVCFVTSRWVLKIGGAGLYWLRNKSCGIESALKKRKGIFVRFDFKDKATRKKDFLSKYHVVYIILKINNQIYD